MSTQLVVYDACVLHSPSLRDVLLRLYSAGLVQARWTDQILDEAFESIRRRRPDLDPARLLRTRQMIAQAFPDGCVTGHDAHQDAVILPDPDDQHVVAAAIQCGAGTIVTLNLKDFPAAALGPRSIEAVHPDDFVADCLSAAPATVIRVLEEQAAALRSPRVELVDLLDVLERQGLVRSMARARRLLGSPR